ncbi:histidine kinase [Sulfuricurvum kujiense DSM 16994]|uniref:histidine kinase n=1 Tax=Sulfuricurvum kujiense (strain ATCC BAA-921 / DSM 16994 / JCM 11577 / YK-1) TaxID=709032 RepID=E4U254_SULKY|nr:HAMP domain-containing sensor histidine kinase [Sulfuricurvum kujiense]ADR34611.1 histidine kinase [Sulfuricurvum kujiense DSM 16994]
MNEQENEEFAFLSRKILELNKQLMESEKVKSRFLSLIASELNNPMTALLGMIPHLTPPAGDPREEIFELAHDEALLLESRIQNLVAASEIESGMMDVTHASVNPEKLVEEALEEFKYKLKRKNISVIVESSLKEKIVTDPKKLYLILKNIIANACDYGDPDAIVNINIVQKGSEIIVTVKNRGHGPNVKYKAQVFTRFAEGMEGSHGLGLGLSIARELCGLIDGKIDYETDETSVTFTVTIPEQAVQADSEACGSNEFLFESFDDAIEL